MTSKIHIPEITLLAIDRSDPSGITRSVDISTRHIEFGEVVLITDHNYFEGRKGYSKWCLTDMWKFVKTSHVLIIHSDSYVVNHKAWDDEWLAWDVIGPSWGYKDGLNCGNGGFSLRSKRLLNILGQIDYTGLNTDFEDCLLGRYLRPWLEDRYNIEFAPDHICNQFAIEAYGSSVFVDSYGHRGNEYRNQFGFHGFHVSGLPEPPIRKQTVNNRRFIRK